MQLRSFYLRSTFDGAHVRKNTRLSLPAQLQCSRSRAEEPGSEAITSQHTILLASFPGSSQSPIIITLKNTYQCIFFQFKFLQQNISCDTSLHNTTVTQGPLALNPNLPHSSSFYLSTLVEYLTCHPRVMPGNGL